MAWTDNAARLHQKGAIAYSRGNRLTIEDVYQVTMPNGVRPLGYDINYRYKDGSTTRSGTISKNVTGIPKRGAAHPDYQCFKATGIDWSQPDARSRVWECRVTYEYTPSSASSATLDDDIVSITFGSVSIQTPILTGSDGASLANTAGDPFDPVPMAEISCPTIDIVRNESTTPASRAEYQGVINNAAVTIAGITFPKWTARIGWTARRIEDEEEEEGGTTVVGSRFQFTYHIEGNFTRKPAMQGDDTTGDYAGWVQYIPNMGWNHLDEGGHKVRNKVRSADDSTAPQDNPQQDFLDADGAVLTEGDPIYIKAFPYLEKSFGTLGLPEEA